MFVGGPPILLDARSTIPLGRISEAQAIARDGFQPRPCFGCLTRESGDDRVPRNRVAAIKGRRSSRLCCDGPQGRRIHPEEPAAFG